MPVIFRHQAYRFFFFSNEGDPREPPHVHVMRDDRRAKFWIRPVALADNSGFPAAELNKLAEIIEGRQDEIERAWHEHFGD